MSVLHLEWSGEELEAVIERGAEALNIVIESETRRRAIDDAHGSVGLLQQLMKALCEAASVYRTGYRKRTIDERHYDEARLGVWKTVQPRFSTFSTRFAGGTTDEGRNPLFAPMLEAAVDYADDGELVTGIPEARLVQSVKRITGSNVTVADLRLAQGELHAYQDSVGVSPIVLAYDFNDRRLFLADRSFLFYRHAGTPSWPWSPS